MLMLKSTHEGRIRALEIELRQARDHINALQADQARLLAHLGLRWIETPATPAGIKLVPVDSDEAKAADARAQANMECLQRARAAAQNANPFMYQGPVGPIVQTGNPPWDRF